jgi:hypothetical protein
MTKDTPRSSLSVRERGTYAKHGDDPTLASYASSLFFLLSVPTFVILAYMGHWMDLYGSSAIVPVFAALLLGSIIVAFGAMHVLS